MMVKLCNGDTVSNLPWHFCIDTDMSIYLCMNKLKLADNLGYACVLVEL